MLSLQMSYLKSSRAITSNSGRSVVMFRLSHFVLASPRLVDFDQSPFYFGLGTIRDLIS